MTELQATLQELEIEKERLHRLFHAAHAQVQEKVEARDKIEKEWRAALAAWEALDGYLRTVQPEGGAK